MTRARALTFVVATMALFCLAPTPGDIGGCGQRAEDLDARVFFESLAGTDCRACQQCGFATATCADACATDGKIPGAFPLGCAPLAHDGEVCLRRLQHDPCDAYRVYVADDSPGHAVSLTSRPRPPSKSKYNY